MSNKNQVKQEGYGGAVQRWGGNWYGKASTINKYNYKSNISKIRDVISNQWRPSDASKYEDSVKALIQYVQREYYAGVYLGK